MSLLAGKTILITGAGGISAATATLASAQGANVFLTSIDKSECESACSAVVVAGGRGAYFVGDITSERVADEAAGCCRDAFNRIDGLFNVVGISGRRFGDGPVHDCTLEGWQRSLQVNLDSAFLMSRAVARVMLEQPESAAGLRGSIVHTSSVLATSPRADHFATHAYAVSKGALLSLASTMAAYYGPKKIRVNALAPGLVRTPMSQRAQANPDIQQLLTHKQPLLRDFLEPADIAGPAVFLLSDWSRGVTGINLVVDGGWSVSD